MLLKIAITNKSSSIHRPILCTCNKILYKSPFIRFYFCLNQSYSHTVYFCGMKKHFFYLVVIVCTIIACKNNTDTNNTSATGNNKKEKTLPPEVIALQQRV